MLDILIMLILDQLSAPKRFQPSLSTGDKFIEWTGVVADKLEDR